MGGQIRGGKYTPAGRGGSWIRPDKRLALHIRDGFRCVYCSRHKDEGANLQIDHYVRIQDGGQNLSTNMITACRACNSSKQNLTIRKWFIRLRARGIDTDKVQRRAKMLMAKDLKPFRKEARRRIASG